ncbi:hypothetical protein [Salipiger mucosus]|uniref:Uncharacterized protein n=1 Tax=Salipiger mucosus DSM 16094 TaxID=1123237 RepID=S9S7E2_9RHOB|nr:hypothetical protein [Salipiger mucosus]EPX82119.1 hypothetical protein Salmuc_02488 [Salipiger mucosus DSM 16094]
MSNDRDADLILAANTMKEVAELPASDLRDNGLRALCGEVQEMLGAPEPAD